MPIKKKPGGRKPKVKLMPAQVLPIGQLLTDLTKRGWSLGAKVGMGGCGEIFLAAPSGNSISTDQATHVIKIEPHANGPLFSELAFYHRAAKAEMIKNWQAKHRDAPYVGVPAYVAEGWHELGGDRWRFMVMERFGEDLEMIFNKHGRVFNLPTVCTVAISLLNSLEYLHNNEYVHADIKGANLLVGRTKYKRHEVYLVDYGLAYRYLADGKHREYKEDPRCAHDGTIEFTSRDAHKGVRPSRRGDLEILGYVLVQWAYGVLPWESNIANKDLVAQEKEKFMKSPEVHLKKLYTPRAVPNCLLSYFSQISKLGYLQQPDYDSLRKSFLKELTDMKINPKKTSHLDWMLTSTPAKDKSQSFIEKSPEVARGASNRVTKRSSESHTSEESTPKKTKVAPSTRPKKAISKQGTRRSPRFDRLSTSPSKTLLDKRRAAREEQLATPVPAVRSRERSVGESMGLLTNLTPTKKNRFDKVNDVYSFRYEDEVVVPVSPLIPPSPVFTRFSPSPSLSLQSGQSTEAMREVARKADLRKARGKKKRVVLCDEDDLEITSVTSKPRTRAAKRNVPTDPLTNPTPEMIKVMHSHGRRKS